MSGAMGQLITIVGSGDMKLKDLNEALGSGILSVVKGYGLSLTDVGAALATFGDNNIRGADAATMLRMAVQAMAVPAVNGRDRLHELGLTTNQLAVDMQKGGLNKAILDLKSHLDNAGVSSKQVGAILTEIFGKRAGPGLAVLIGQTDRLEQKFAVLRDSSSSFGAKWKATTQTASFALAQLNAKLEAAAITLTAKLGPGIASVANWLGTELPHAIRFVQGVLAPLEHLGAGVFTGLAVGARGAASALHTVGSALGPIEPEVRAAGSAVVLMWAAFKAYKLATIALTAVNLGIGRLVLAANTGYVAMTRLALGETEAAGAAAGLGAAAGRARLSLIGMQAGTGAAALGIAGLTAAGLLSVSAIGGQRSASGELVNAYKAQTKSTDLSAAAIIRWAASSSLMKEDLINIGALTAHTGTSMAELARGVSGTDAQFKAFTASIKANHDLSTTDKASLDMLHGAFKNTAAAAKDSAAATGKSTTAAEKNAAANTNATRTLQWGVTASGQIRQAMVLAGTAIDTGTAAMQRQTAASTLLKGALDVLNGVAESVEQSTDAYNLALAQLKNGTSLAKDENGNLSRSLDQTTVAGIQNRQMLTSLIDLAKSQAQATADSVAARKGETAGLIAGNRQLKANEDQIRTFAAAQHLSKGETDAMIASLGKIATIKAAPKVTLNPKEAAAKIAILQRQINDIRQGKVPGISTDTYEGKVMVAGLQHQIDVLRQHNVPGLTANTVAAAARVAAIQRQINAIRQNKVPSLTANTAPALLRIRQLQNKIDTMRDHTIHVTTQFANSGNPGTRGDQGGVKPKKPWRGGYISGPGSGTSDSIPAMISNGEFVMNAAVTKRNRALFEAINAGRNPLILPQTRKSTTNTTAAAARTRFDAAAATAAPPAVHLTNYTLPGQSNDEIGSIAAARIVFRLRR
jgi:trimeric autotransporter adhesin